MVKLSIEELRKLREKAKDSILLREGSEFRVKVIVHMGTCGIAAGARDIMSTLMDEIVKNNIKDVLISSSGCAGMCSNEPMITVEVQGKAPVKYIKLNPSKAQEIFRKHIIEGTPIAEYILGIGSERSI